MNDDDRIDALLSKVETIRTAAQRFTDEMRAQGIHVGLGGAIVRCVTCGRPWPCDERNDR